jgi:hypothetical protein
MWYIGMGTDNAGVVSFEYGTLSDAGVPAVLVLGENKLGDLPQGPTLSHYDTDGTITLRVPKSSVGNPQSGDLLGAIGGKTITGDTDSTRTFQRSTAFVDHTFIKGQSDNTYPPATYTLVGNTACSAGTIVPVTAVSRKTHGTSGDFDIDLPLTGGVGVECRVGSVPNRHTVVVTFAAPVTVSSATVTPGSGGATAAVSGSPMVNGSQVTVNLTNVSNAQTLTLNLIGVSDGTNSGTVAIPMGVLLGDVDGSRRVDSTDVSQVRQNTLQDAAQSNYRNDVNSTGRIDSADVLTVRQQTLTGLQ